MNLKELHAALRTLWNKSQVPFDLVNLSAYTGLPADKLNGKLALLVKAEALARDEASDPITWSYPAPRPLDGPETLERFERLEKMRAEVKAKVRADAAAKRGELVPAKASSKSDEKDAAEDDDDDPSILAAGGRAAKGALSIVSRAAGKLDGKPSKKKKSLAASAALSLMGPAGWLYAGSFREAVPAVGLFALLAWIIPSPILWPLLWFVLPVSSLAGLVYAWQFNRNGQRRTLLLPGADEKPKK